MIFCAEFYFSMKSSFCTNSARFDVEKSHSLVKLHFFRTTIDQRIFFPLVVKSCHKSVHKTSKWAEVKKHIKCAGKHMIGTLKLYFSRERLVSHFGLWVRFLFISNSLSARTDFFPHLLSFSRSFFLILQGGCPSP